MTDSYLPIVVMAILGTLFAALSFGASSLLAPRRPTAAKLAPYECGIVPEHEPAERFPVKFYGVAMAFIIFDVEIVFIYPWAVVHRDLGVFGLVAMGIFVVPFLVAYGFELASGALDWGPARRIAAHTREPVLRAANVSGLTPVESAPRPPVGEQTVKEPVG